MRAGAVGGQLDAGDFPALLEAALAGARAELHLPDLHRIAQRHELQPRLGQALAAVLALLAEAHGHGLADLLAFDGGAADAQHQRVAVAGVPRHVEHLRGRHAAVGCVELVHEEIGAEQQGHRAQQHQRFPPAALHAEPQHGDGGKQQRGQRAGRDHAQQLGPAVHVDQQELGVEDPDEGQDDGAQRVDGALDAGLDGVLVRDGRRREGGQSHGRRDVAHDPVIEDEQVHGDQRNDQARARAQLHHHGRHERGHQHVVGRGGHAQAQHQADEGDEQQHHQHVALGDELHELRHAQAQAGERDGAHDDAGGGRGRADADHVARAVVKALHHAAHAPDPDTGCALPAEPLDQRVLRDHQHDEQGDRPEGRERGRHLLDHQAPDQHADGHEVVEPGAHRRPGLQGLGVGDVDVLGQVVAARGLLHRHQVQRQHHGGRGPGRGGAQQRVDAAQQVVQRAHHRNAARHADQIAHHAHAPGLVGGLQDGLKPHLQRLQVHDVEQADVGQRGRQKRVLDDLGIRDAHVLHHQEGRGAHHRRHDLAVDRTHGFDGAGLHAAVARLLHERNGEDAARDHVGHRRARDHAVERRRHHRHLGRPAAQMAQRCEADLHHVVAAARAVEQRAEQHIDEYGAGRHAQRNAVHPLGGEPHVRHQPRQRGALVRQHLRQPGPGHAVGQEEQRQRRHGPADGAARSFEQQHQPRHGHGNIEPSGLTGPRGDLRVEQHDVGRGERGHGRQKPVDGGHALARRALERRPGQEGQEHGERQVDGARLGVVQDAPTHRERQRRGVPVLEQGPGQRDGKDDVLRQPRGLAPARVGVGHELLQSLGGFFNVGGHGGVSGRSVKKGGEVAFAPRAMG